MKLKTIVVLSIISSGVAVLLWPKKSPKIAITDLQLRNFMRRLEAEEV